VSAVEVVAIGASRGGFTALQLVLGGLPARFAPAVVIVQHRRAEPESHLAQLLASSCKLPLIEPEDKTPLQPGHVYLAPSDYHLLVEPGFIALSVDAPVRFARPSIDVLFESTADAYGPAALGVMLTSASDDGAEGARAIKAAGGRMFVQDPATAESPIGPRAALAATQVDGVLTLELVAQTLVALCGTLELPP
jgi:two-component system chemotaxis response regulator CheB